MPTLDPPKIDTRPRGGAKGCGGKTAGKAKIRRYFYHCAQWRRLRALYLADNPLCERCLDAGRYVPAVDVHHREGFADKGEHWRAWATDYGNLMAVCKRCHGIIHSTEEGDE